MKYNTVYIVINEGEVVYASEDKEDADAYADTKGYEARQRVLPEAPPAKKAEAERKIKSKEDTL